jgi:hypothetical protein
MNSTARKENMFKHVSRDSREFIRADCIRGNRVNDNWIYGVFVDSTSSAVCTIRDQEPVSYGRVPLTELPEYFQMTRVGFKYLPTKRL